MDGKLILPALTPVLSPLAHVVHGGCDPVKGREDLVCFLVGRMTYGDLTSFVRKWVTSRSQLG